MTLISQLPMLAKTSKVFVTGGTGVVGSQILHQLLFDGWTNIVALRRSTSQLPQDLVSNVTWIEGDILDVSFIFDQIEGVDVVIHAAAEVGFSLRRRDQIIKTSLNGTANLVNASLDYGVKKFVFISSVAAIGRQKEEETIDEKKIFSHSRFDTSYGLAKFLAEQEVWRGHAEGLPCAVVNPSMILGPGNNERSSLKVIDKIYKQKLSYYPMGTNGWVDVRDVAKAVILCLDERINGERFILSSSSLPYGKVFANIAEHLKVPFVSKPLSAWLAQIAWRIAALKSWWSGDDPMVTKETVISTAARSTYDNSKSIQVLGLNYRSIDETIKESCSSYLTTNTHSLQVGT